MSFAYDGPYYAAGSTWRHCQAHGIAYNSAMTECGQCAAERVCAQTSDRPDATALRLNVLSQTIDYLLRRQSDLELEVFDLRRQVRALQHGRIAGQRAHNRLATMVEQLEEAHNLVVAYAESLEADRE